MELDLDRKVVLIGRGGRVYHSWTGCLGSWRPARITTLGDLLDSTPRGRYGPCLRCLHGAAPMRRSA